MHAPVTLEQVEENARSGSALTGEAAIAVHQQPRILVRHGQQPLDLIDDAVHRGAGADEAGQERLERTLKLVEGVVDGQDWLMSQGFSGVDCAVGWSVWTAGRFVRLSPALQGYADRCTGREAFERSLPQEGDPRFYEKDFYELPDG